MKQRSAIFFHVPQLVCSHDFSPLRPLFEAQHQQIEAYGPSLVLASMPLYAGVASGNSPPRQPCSGSESLPSRQPKPLKKSEVRCAMIWSTCKRTRTDAKNMIDEEFRLQVEVIDLRCGRCTNHVDILLESNGSAAVWDHARFRCTATMEQHEPTR